MGAGTPGAECSRTGGAGPGSESSPRPHWEQGKEIPIVAGHLTLIVWKTPHPRRPQRLIPPSVPCGAAPCGSGPPVPSHCGWGSLSLPFPLLLRGTSVSSPVQGSAGHSTWPRRIQAQCQRDGGDSSGHAVASAGLPPYRAHVPGGVSGPGSREPDVPPWAPPCPLLSQHEHRTELREVPVFEDGFPCALCASRQLHQG